MIIRLNSLIRAPFLIDFLVTSECILQEETPGLTPGNARILPKIALFFVKRQDDTPYARKRLNKSTGSGRTTVELLSADTSTRLCRNLRCMAAGCFAMISAASASFCEA